MTSVSSESESNPQYEYKVEYEVLSISTLSESGKRSFQWHPRVEHGSYAETDDLYRKLLYAADKGTVPHVGTGINSLVRSVVAYKRIKTEWEAFK